MYDPKFTQKQMYDQYGSSLKTTTNANKQFAETMKSSGGGRNMSGIGAKPVSRPFDRGSTYDEVPEPTPSKPEDPSNIEKVKNKFVDLMKFFGGKESKEEKVDGKAVYKGPMFTNTPIDIDAQMARIRDAVDYSKAPPLVYTAYGSTYDTVPPVTSNKDRVKNAVNAFLKQRGIGGKEYTIKRGDTLSEIAQREGVAIDDLAKINKIENINRIIAGETLIIPAPQEVERVKDFVDSVDPDAQFYQSQVPMDQREFEPELGYDEIPLPSEAKVDKKIKGLGARPEVTVTELDAPLIDTSPRTQGELLDTDGVNSIDFNDELLDELVDLEGRGGDFLSSTPTYDLGITESKANEYNLDPDDYTTFGDFAKDFTKQYVDEKYLENKDIFKTVDKENHTALMSYLWNVGSFGTAQTTALEDNDMREFVAEMKDAIGSEGFSSSGLSARRAKEANMIGENLDDWNPIVKVVITGTRANPTFTWEDADGNTVEEYTTTRSLHPENVKNKPNANDVLNEEINL